MGRRQETLPFKKRALIFWRALWKEILIAGVVLLAILGACLWYIHDTQSATTSLQAEISPVEAGCLNVYMLDVGQGDSILLISPEGKTMLVDTGSEEKGNAVLGALASLGIERLDILLLTHAHEDHAGAAESIIKKIPVDRVCLAGDVEDYGEALAKRLSRNKVETCSLQAGESIDWGKGCTVAVLSPFSDRPMGDENDASAVVRVAYKNSSILLCADATVDTENLLMALYSRDALQSTVIKLAHHGSNSSSSRTFLEMVSPELALISVGANNGYGHPAPEVLERLTELKIPYISTEEGGTVQIVLDGTGAQVIK